MKRKKTNRAAAARSAKRELLGGYKPVKSSFNMEPLPATFSLTGLMGFIITTVFTVSGRVPLSWGVAFDLVFMLMFISSMISITPRFTD